MSEAAEQQLDGNGDDFGGEPKVVEGDGVPKGDGIEVPADGSPVDLVASPALPKGRIRIPEDTRGHYVVLVARKPPRGVRPAYEEALCVKSHDVPSAKRRAMEDSTVGPALTEMAAQKPGILLRAVPAMHWPQDVEPTTFVRPEPILQIG